MIIIIIVIDNNPIDLYNKQCTVAIPGAATYQSICGRWLSAFHAPVIMLWRVSDVWKNSSAVLFLFTCHVFFCLHSASRRFGRDQGPRGLARRQAHTFDYIMDQNTQNLAFVSRWVDYYKFIDTFHNRVFSKFNSCSQHRHWTNPLHRGTHVACPHSSFPIQSLCVANLGGLFAAELAE